MCGIWFYLNKKDKLTNNDKTQLIQISSKIQRRGPDNTQIVHPDVYSMLVFHRLSVMDPTSRGHQPFISTIGKMLYYCICNGEIYNYRELIEKYKINVISGSDCEVILPLYHMFGSEFVNLLDGYFSIIITELNTDTTELSIFTTRDRFGVRPLYINNNSDYINLSSEIKGLKDTINVKEFPPGYSAYITHSHIEFKQYYKYLYPRCLDTEEEAKVKIRDLFYEAVKKRLITDRPVVFLLSGGVDSSLVAGVASKLIGRGNRIKTFCIGMEGGTDFAYSKMVANYIGSEHTEVKFTPEEGLTAISDVIKCIESYDITTVRASVGQFLISKWISEHTENKVVFIGDGSDEVCSGYLYNYKAPSPDDVHNEAVRRIKDIHMYDGRRADRCISFHGLEARLPFLDHNFVNYYLSIDPYLRSPNKERMEKYLLRKSFVNEGVIPDEVLWRKKEAFSDGVSSMKRSWFQIIKEWVDVQISDEEFISESVNITHNTPKTKEAYYYRKIFRQYYSCDDIIPYMWLPLWVDEKIDPSARVLSIYS